MFLCQRQMSGSTQSAADNGEHLHAVSGLKVPFSHRPYSCHMQELSFIATKEDVNNLGMDISNQVGIQIQLKCFWRMFTVQLHLMGCFHTDEHMLLFHADHIRPSRVCRGVSSVTHQ